LFDDLQNLEKGNLEEGTNQIPCRLWPTH